MLLATACHIHVDFHGEAEYIESINVLIAGCGCVCFFRTENMGYPAFTPFFI